MHIWKLKVKLKKSRNRRSSSPALYASCILAFVLTGLFLWNVPVFAKERTDAIVITAKQIKGMNVRKISDVLNQVPGRAIGNFRLEYCPSRAAGRYGRLEFFAEVKNIADKTYRYGDGWLAPPRTWVLGVNYRF